MNHHFYPKIHYPEIYILEGGYCQYFKQSAARCQPRGYTSMDDPHHATARREDLDQFRKTKFGRVKSYAYGEGDPGGIFARPGNREQVGKRNTVPIGGGALFAAADAARTKRGGPGLKAPAEDGNTIQEEDEGVVMGTSPCPPANKRLSRGGEVHRPLLRAETLDAAKLAWGI
jgi:M-phase inducer tyrosine phosphatase